MRLETVFFIAVATCLPCRAFAQIRPAIPDSSKVRVRIGPLWMNPTIALTNAGIDTNVFNEPDQDAPKSDFTMTFTPATDAWLHMGRTWLLGTVREDVVWYKEYASERAANDSLKVAWLVPLTRISFSVGADWLNTRERPGYEIDARSQRTELGYNGILELRALSKTLIGVHADRRVIAFDRDARFFGNNLHDEFNRTATTAGVTLRHELTPLTSVVLDASRAHDRFEFAPLRDSDSTRASLGVRFDPAALISGAATFGVRDYKPLDPAIPGYKGFASAVDLGYVAAGSTRFAVTFKRDVDYSFDLAQPYYLETGIEGSIAQQIFGPVDAVARGGSHRLAYRDRTGGIVEAARRTDDVKMYGGGLGYRVGGDLRVGFNVDRAKRDSILEHRRYDGLRYGISVTYGQ